MFAVRQGLPEMRDYAALRPDAQQGGSHSSPCPVGGQPLKPTHIRQMAERWRPWRAYAAMLLWMM